MSASEELRIYSKYKGSKTQVEQIYRDCYAYAIPHRHVLDFPSQDNISNDVQIFDSTAVDSSSKFGDTLHMSITPPDSRWLKFSAGSKVNADIKPQVNLLLGQGTDQWFDLMGRSNFQTEIGELYADLGVGTGAVLIQNYDDELSATFTAVPATQLTIGEGPSGMVDKIWREWHIKAGEIRSKWPSVRMPEDIASAERSAPTTQFQILEVTRINYSTGEWTYKVIAMKSGEELFNDKFKVSPWVVSRYKKVSGEVWGRGPLVNALADIKTANKVVEMVLQNGALAIAGVYTAADDGVLNPETVEIAPGVVIPVGFNGGVNGRSLDVLPRAGDFDVSQLVIGDLRDSIRRKLLDTGAETLQTVRSAEEIRERASRIAKDLGGAYARFQNELIGGIVKRTLHMWGESGDMPRMKIDNEVISITHTSPLSEVQDLEDLDNLSGAAARMNNIAPGLAAVSLKPEKVGPYIGEKSGVPQELIASEEEIVQAQQQAGELASQGVDVSSIANAVTSK